MRIYVNYYTALQHSVCCIYMFAFVRRGEISCIYTLDRHIVYACCKNHAKSSCIYLCDILALNSHNNSYGNGNDNVI